MQQQLDKERKLKSELSEQISQLEKRVRQSENNLSNRLAEEETQLKIKFAGREAELRLQLKELEDKVVCEKERRIKVISDSRRFVSFFFCVKNL